MVTFEPLSPDAVEDYHDEQYNEQDGEQSHKERDDYRFSILNLNNVNLSHHGKADHDIQTPTGEGRIKLGVERRKL